MVLAAEYPLLEVFWTIALISLWVMWIWLVVFMLVDNFRREDHGGMAKAVWTVLLIVLPLFGVLMYMITRPNELGSIRGDAGGGYPPYRGDPTQ